ncbi:MAG: hypothetical protein AAB665_00050 [Patescibacteria group bacterium]
MTDSVEFIQPHKVGDELFLLPSGDQVSIQKYFLEFKNWQGAPILNTYNGKAVIDWEGEPVFAELAVLRLFQSHGWDGVWVDSYRRKFRVGLPDVVDPIELPQKQRQLIDSIRAKTGRSGGCWDVLVWKGNTTLFVELKRQKKDNVQDTQVEWLTAALALGFGSDHFALVEWDVETDKLA